MQTLAAIKQSALITGLCLVQAASADNAVTIPSADATITTASSQQPLVKACQAQEPLPDQQPEKAPETTPTTETTLTVTAPEQQTQTEKPVIPSAETTLAQQPEPSLPSATEIDPNRDLLSEYIRATPNLASTQTLSELLSQLEKVKEDLDRCQDDEMYIVIKNKEAEIKKRLESMNTEYLQYLALMQQTATEDNTILYAALATSATVVIGSAIFLATR